MQKIKFGVDVSTLVENRTGVGNYIYNYLLYLVENLKNVNFYLYSNSTIFFPDYPNVYKRVGNNFLRGPLFHNLYISRKLFSDGIDIYWASNGVFPFIKPSKIKIVTTIHDFVYKLYPKTMIWYKRIFKELSQNFSIKFTDYIYCVSNATSRDLTYFFGRESNGVFNPLVDYGFFSNKAQNERLFEFKYFCVLGTIEPRKNIFNLLSAYKNVIAKGYLLPKLVMIGGKGWKNKQLHSLIEAGIADGTIIYPGFLENALLPRVYGGCEFFIMPSVYEGFGIPILEAQYSGAPVVHGVHGSMCEASADVSLKIETDIKSIEQFLISYSEGNAQLQCRHFKGEDLSNKNKLDSFLDEIKSVVKQICHE